VDREHSLAEQRRIVGGPFDVFAGGSLLCLLAPLDLLDRALGGRLGEATRDQEVAQLALGHVHDRSLLTELLYVLEEYRFRHCSMIPSISSRARGGA